MKNIILLFCLIVAGTIGMDAQKIKKEKTDNVEVDRFADISVLKYEVPGFDKLSPKQKELAYYLSQAAYAGREIFQDQNCKYNLLIRRSLEAIYTHGKAQRDTKDYAAFVQYCKQIWFANGIHHHYSSAKILPQFSETYFRDLFGNTPAKYLSALKGENGKSVLETIIPVMFNPEIMPIKVNQAANVDVVTGSANNFYEGVTQKEVEDYYKSKIDAKDPHPVSIGLNSKLIKKDGQLVERVWKVGGMYSPAIEKIVYWLKKALPVAENEQQKKTLGLLIKYYQTGDLRVFDEYCIEWVKDVESVVDLTNGYIETYGDPLNYKATYESIVSFKDFEASKRIDAISKCAQWFEDNSPISTEHKKKNVKGISAKVITVVAEAGDASPSTPIGINLPNANWIRKEHGSKSVNLGNIVHSYNQAASEGMLNEFAFSNEEIELAKKYANLSDDLHTDMHEVIGHASGQIKPGVGTPRESLKNYASTIEEARADLVALYYIIDPKLVEIGVLPSVEAGKAEYDKYIRNGIMTQLNRVKPGENIEEAHMRNRQLIAQWAYEKGKASNVIERVKKDGKTFFVIRDYAKLRVIFGEMLREIQRVTSEGDFAAAQNLVETYGVKVDKELHAEVLKRFENLHIAPYKGFVNPVLKPVTKNGKIVDVKIEYIDDFPGQMLDYSKKYSFLPAIN
ncbi:MAG: dipeptidyl peptidase 3 [Ignavibacteria bacterium]|nr:dipeptidyl peptidase 3 [Ignavibacteria bacterium]